MEGTDLDAFVLKVCGIEHSQLESQREEAIQARKSDPSAPKLSVGNSDKPQILAQDGPKDSAIGRIVDLEASAGRVIDGISRPSREKIDRVDNVESVGACARMVAPALEWNPRRIKQFINLLRLRIHLTGRMGFLELNADAKDDETKMSGGFSPSIILRS